jgi:hypothetical protein
MPTDLGNVSRFVDITIELIDRCLPDAALFALHLLSQLT